MAQIKKYVYNHLIRFYSKQIIVKYINGNNKKLLCLAA